MGPFGVTPTGLLPTHGSAHTSGRNDVSIEALLKLSCSSAYATTSNPAFYHQNVCWAALSQREKRLSVNEPPTHWDGQDQSYTE
jgi:hypothetical protein